jgi:inhibitor of KinA sporulation pathway (predicted exonuclease)
MVFKAELDSLLEGKTDEEKVAALEDLINSGDYDGAALDHLSNMLDRIEEGEVIKAEMEALREEFKDLTKEERQAKIQEMIDSDDYDEAVTERLTKMLERKDQMGDKIRKKLVNLK